METVQNLVLIVFSVTLLLIVISNFSSKRTCMPAGTMMHRGKIGEGTDKI